MLNGADNLDRKPLSSQQVRAMGPHEREKYYQAVEAAAERRYIQAQQKTRNRRK